MINFCKSGTLPWYIKNDGQIDQHSKKNAKTEILFIAADLGHYI
jgi:hypothetical protein